VRASHPASIVLVPLLLLAAAAPARGADTPTPGTTPVPAATPQAGPAQPLTRRGGIAGLDVMTSTVFQEGQSSFSGIALRMRIRSATLLPNIEFMPAVEFWQNNNQIGLFGLKTTRSDATFGGSARWVFSHEHWQPYAGLGAGVHFLDEKVNAPQLGVVNQHDSTVRGSYSLLGGVMFTLTPHFGNFLELEYHGMSHFRQTKFNTGLGWSF
jgi:hypothetical protein